MRASTWAVGIRPSRVASAWPSPKSGPEKSSTASRRRSRRRYGAKDFVHRDFIHRLHRLHRFKKSKSLFLINLCNRRNLWINETRGEEMQAIQSTDLLFEISHPGRRCHRLPACDVPGDAELLPAEFLAKEAPPLPELAEIDLIRHFVNLS